MKGSLPVGRPHDVVIWSSSSMLAVMAGAGAAFLLWSQFQGMDTSPSSLGSAVVMLGTGAGLLATTVSHALGRAFVWIAAATFVTAFFLGAPLFQALLG